MSKKHKPATDFVEPDLPITPMLDMSFQLMAFFVFTFRPMPSEGQISMALPKEEGNSSSTALPDITDDVPDKVTVTVTAGDNGTPVNIKLTDDTGSKDLGADSAVYFAAMKQRRAERKGKPGKVNLEMDPRLIHQYVVKLIDETVRAGYEDIAPTPIKTPKN